MKFLLAAGWLCLAGCAGVDLPRGVYEGVRQHARSQADPTLPATVAPDYDAYRTERERLQASPQGSH